MLCDGSVLSVTFPMFYWCYHASTVQFRRMAYTEMAGYILSGFVLIMLVVSYL